MANGLLQFPVQEEYIYDIPTRGIISIPYDDVVNDTHRLISFLTSLNLAFDAYGLLEMFEFLNDRPYVLHQFPTIRETVHDIIHAVRPILDDRYNENGLVRQSGVLETDDLMNQCRQIETLIDAVERL